VLFPAGGVTSGRPGPDGDIDVPQRRLPTARGVIQIAALWSVRPVSVPEVVAALRAGGALPGKAVVQSFQMEAP
jgi:hypothetical protein